MSITIRNRVDWCRTPEDHYSRPSQSSSESIGFWAAVVMVACALLGALLA